MERMLATPADAEIVIGLYQLRTEAVMREARAWMTGEFWPVTAEEFFCRLVEPRPSSQRALPAGDFLLGDGRGHGAARGGFS
jgi:hypothetical protein